MNNLQNHIKNYLEYCKMQKRLDEKTLKAYRIDLQQFSEQIYITETANFTSTVLENSHEQNSTYSVFMHVCEAWQPLLSLQIYSNNQLQMV